MIKVQQELFSLADERYKTFQSSLVPSVDPETVIGVRVPVLRRFAKLLPPLQVEEFLSSLPHRYFDENNLHAFLIERIADFEECVAAIERFLPYVDNWATCDSMRPPCFAKHKDALFAKCRDWIASSRPFTVRYGLEMLMVHGMGEAFDPVFLEMAANVNTEEYYVHMMVAWFFATALTKQYDATLPYIQQHRLDTKTHNKAIQKACESLVIPSEIKAYLKTLKG